MKILTQDRKRIIEMPREIWIVRISDQGWIYSTSYINAELAHYDTVGRADAVLKEIFQYYRNGKNSYIMPEE